MRNVTRFPARALMLATLLCGVAISAPAAASKVYKWVDENGTMHLSSSKPAAGVKYETLDVGSSSSGGVKSPSSRGTGNAAATSPQQAAQRSEVLASLRNRECVIALEALDRLTSGSQATSAAEITRLKQTSDANCSSDPDRRREQEAMAAKLRVANGPECIKARNELADLTARGSKATPDRLRVQQVLVETHCIPPVQ